jgi:hypothetical protein
VFDERSHKPNYKCFGVATFPDLRIDNTGQYSLTFSSAGIDDAVSMNINVLSGTVSNRFKGSNHSGFTTLLTESQKLGQTPARIELLTQPWETVAGIEIEGPPRIVVYDEFERPMGGVSVTVTTSQSFTAASEDQLITDANGEILWDNLVIETPGTYTLPLQLTSKLPWSAPSQPSSMSSLRSCS